jgi:hypothetical protein
MNVGTVSFFSAAGMVMVMVVVVTAAAILCPHYYINWEVRFFHI